MESLNLKQQESLTVKSQVTKLEINSETYAILLLYNLFLLAF